jgi:hypothetical protein
MAAASVRPAPAGYSKSAVLAIGGGMLAAGFILGIGTATMVLVNMKQAGSTTTTGAKGTAAETAAPIPIELPPAKVKNKGLQDRVRNVGKVNVHELRLEPPALPCLVWADDGKSFTSLDADGHLRSVALDGFEEKKELDLGRKATWMSSSAEGLVVAIADPQEVWVVDADKLQVKKRIPVTGGASRVVSTPGLSIAFAAKGGGRIEEGLAVLDLKKGETVRELGSKELPDTAWGALTITPDAKLLFATSRTHEQLQRFRIDDKARSVALEQSSARIASAGQGIYVSPDSQHVAMPSGGGNTSVYPVSDLTKPAFTVPSGAHPGLIAFDPKAELVYGHNETNDLVVFNAEGIKQQAYKLAAAGEEPTQLAVHPDGYRLLMLTKTKLLFVELPKR